METTEDTDIFQDEQQVLSPYNVTPEEIIVCKLHLLLRYLELSKPLQSLKVGLMQDHIWNQLSVMWFLTRIN